MKHKTISLFFAIMALVAFSGLALAGSATLHWGTSPESDLAGYRVYYGVQSRSYGPYIPIGPNVHSYTVNGLVEGKTYYFALTAVDRSGNESGYSKEVSKTISKTTSTSSKQTTSTSNKMAPVLDVKVNGKDEAITLKQNTPVHVMVTLAPGDYSGQMADWWLYAIAEFDGKSYEFSYIYPLDWSRGRLRSYKGRIGPVRPLDIVYPRLLPGVYTITFAVDANADRHRDNTWHDSVRITVTP